MRIVGEMCIFRKALEGRVETELAGHRMAVEPLGRGRFREEWNYGVYVDGRLFCRAKYFMGRGIYRPWIELYSFTDEWLRHRDDEEFLASFLRLVGECLGVGESLFIEYVHDPRLTREIEKARDPGDTYLGRILRRAGFDRLRDWYIPEGMWEGGQKLEAWRSVDREKEGG